MNETKDVPLSGYTLERVFAQEQHFEGLGSYDGLPADAPSNINFGWDWQVQGDERFVVIITLTIEPTRARPERATVTMAGVFYRFGEEQSVPFEQFVFTHAPSILMPYAREAISSLTGRGLNGPLHLPPINVMALMSEMNPDLATGNNQILTRPEIARHLGVTKGSGRLLRRGVPTNAKA